MFAHDAKAGTLEPAGNGTYALRLTVARPSALFFEDRPGRQAGNIELRRMLAGFFEKQGQSPPNAAVNVSANGVQRTLGVELLKAHYEPRLATLSYTIRILPQSSE